MGLAIPPIGEGHIIVYADEIDIGIGPKRIKMEIAIIAAVIWLIAEIFGPISRIGQFGARAQELSHIRRQRAQSLHRHKPPAGAANLRQAAHF